MTTSRITILDSLAALRSQSAAWDDLWFRSEVAAPSARAEMIAQWVEHYAPRSRFRAVTVERDGRLIAALPIVAGRRGKLLPCGQLPSNQWSPCGDLLVDPEIHVPTALDQLVAGCRQLPWPILWFNAVISEAPRWRAFIAALDRAGIPWAGHRRTELDVGLVDLSRDWQQVQAEWSGNHRRHMRKALKRAEAKEGVQLRVFRNLAPGEVEPLLRRGFEVEDRSWKGSQAQSSVLRMPGNWEFFLGQARQAAAWGQLALVFLEHRGRPIAFEYGWSSKGVFFSPKVGYDEAFAHLSPGQLLRLKLIEQFCAQGDHQVWDFFGPLTDATAKWTTGKYSVARLVVGTHPLAGRSVLSAYKTLRRWLHHWRGEPGQADEHEPAADPLPEFPMPAFQPAG